MNPPYNAMAKQVPKDYAKTWGKSKQDPSKGLYFVKFILDQMNEHDMQGKLAVLLPMACAIGNSTLMKQMKGAILKNNTLVMTSGCARRTWRPTIRRLRRTISSRRSMTTSLIW